MSIPVSIDPLGTLGVVAPVPELADSIIVPKLCAMVLPLNGRQEFLVEFNTAFDGQGPYNLLAGALAIVSYGDGGWAGWFTYRSFSGQPQGSYAWAGKPQSYIVTAKTSSLNVVFNGHEASFAVSGELRATDMTLAYPSPRTPEREVDIPLTGGAFVVKEIDGTLLHDYRFRADALGFYDMVERKNYYFNA